MTNAEANRIIAEWVWEEGSDEPILVMDNEGYITAPVDTSRRVPPDYCSSLDLTVAAIKGKFSYTLENRRPNKRTWASVWVPGYGPGSGMIGHDSLVSDSAALAHAVAEAIRITARAQEASK